MSATYTRYRFRAGLYALLLLGGILASLSSLRRVAAKPTWESPPHKSGSINPATGWYLGDGTKRMAALLKTLAAIPDPQRDHFALSEQRIQSLQDHLKQAAIPPNIRLSLIGQLAEDLLNAGRTEDALKTYADYTRVALKYYPDFYQKELRWMTEKNVAMCYLRLGEQQNCCANNNTDSCLLPIRGQGIHTKQFGSREGMKRLVHLLDADTSF